MAADAMKVVLVSKVWLNPYVSLMCDGLRQARVGLQCLHRENLSPLWLLLRGRNVDVIHLHWAELLCSDPGPWRNHYNLAMLTLGLRLAKRMGIRTVYTIHNLHPHEDKEQAGMGEKAQRTAIQLADAVHVHSGEVAEQARLLYGRRKNIFVIPHPSYEGYYPDDVSREEARRKLGVPRDAFVYIFLGLVRPYKGISELIVSFRRLPDCDARLVIAGAIHAPECGETIRSLAEGDNRVVTHLSYVPPEEVQFYLRSGDICVLPYRHVTTSGAAMLAFTFGCPVLAPAIGPFPALVGDGERGILFRPDDPDDLFGALEQAQKVDLPRMSASAKKYASALAWPLVAKEHLRVYDFLMEGRENAVG